LISGGGWNNPYLLDSSTLSDDAGAIDNLFGEGDQDWFLVSAGDLTPDWVESGPGAETKTQVP
jgi:hypothetical protein